MWFWSSLVVDVSGWVGAPAPNYEEDNNNEKQNIPDEPTRPRTQRTYRPFGHHLTPTNHLGSPWKVHALRETTAFFQTRRG